MRDIIIPNEGKLEDIKQKMKIAGSGSIHILADFDRTLTYSLQKNGTKIPSIISVLRDNDYLSSEYSAQAKTLFTKYHPIEIDSKISTQERKLSMQKWWDSHNKLLLRYGLNRKNLKEIVNSGIVRLRGGVRELFDYTNKRQIPLIIMSSSGLGDAISMILEKEKILYDNVYLITNKFEWDKNGDAIKALSPVINCMNKDETAVRDYPEVYKKIKHRKSVILIGDSLGDIGMVSGFRYDNLIKVGFLNPNEEQNKSQYEKNFDIIITGDSDITPINKLLKNIIE